MSVPFILLIILFILMIFIGGRRGAKSFFSLVFNFFTLIFMIFLIRIGFDPIKITVLGCIIISSITLFYINGFNKKTAASFISVTIVVIISILLTVKMGTDAQIQGFSKEQVESIAYLSLNVNIDFTKIVICVILIGLLGAIIDVSISISSSMNEIYINNGSVSKRSLLNSGINIGKDILGTMTNTLLFAFIGGFMTLIIWFSSLDYKISDIINSKVFCSEVFQIISSGVGVILIIPITAITTLLILTVKKPGKNI